MKWLVRILVVLVILVVVLVVVASLFLGSIVKTAAEKAGPMALGVPIKLEKASFQLLRGKISLHGFVLGNPEGFKTEQAIGVGEVTVELEPKSLLTDTIVIKRIYVDAPDITYELGLGKSNIGRILEQASGPEKAEAKVEPEEKKAPATDEKAGKKVVIEDFLIENGHIRISTTLAMGAAAPIPLPTIHLTDIGKDTEGASPIEVIRQVLGAIVGSVTKVVTGAAGLVGDGAQAVGEGAVKTVDATAEVVGDGAKAVGGAVLKTGEAVGEGASKVIGGVTGIFKSDKPTNEPSTDTQAP